MSESQSLDAFKSSPVNSVKHSAYFPVYDKLFGSYRGKDIVFVEIGVLEGGSLFMWREFFGSNARIIGVDINSGAKKWADEGFEIFIGSQSDPEFWKRFFEEVGDVDVILDDGGHTFEQQIVTAECTVENIRDGGILLVEDVCTSYMRQYGGPSAVSFVSYAKNIIDGVNYRSQELSHQHERAIYSVQFFESMAVFYIDRALCELKSQEVSNGGRHMPPEYFQYSAERSATVQKAGRFARGFNKYPRVYRVFLRLNKLRKTLMSAFNGGQTLKRYFKY